MKINNCCLLEREKDWLNCLLAEDFLYREQVIYQIEHADIFREYNEYFISLHFHIEPNIKKLNIQIRVPLEMRVFFSNAVPIQFLLHIIDGFINELEIFKADSTRIDPGFELEKSKKIERIFADEITISS